MEIKILSSGNIDPGKWDHTVLTGRGGTLFAFYEYLQQMTPAWSGLIIGDYTAVLPLIYKSKFGIRYICTIPFVKQLGLIGHLPETAVRSGGCNNLYHDIFKAIHAFARYGDISFSHQNNLLFPVSCDKEQVMEGGTISPVTNYEIDLSIGYDGLLSRYHPQVKKRLARNKKEGLFKYSQVAAEKVLPYYSSLLKTRAGLLLEPDFRRLRQLMQTDFGRQHFTGYQVQRSGNDEVLLRGVYGKDHNRIYNFMTAVTQEGRKQHASVYALDHVVAAYAGEPLIFDFMGSSLAGVEAFIQSFGAENRTWSLYHFNRLPWPLKLLKR